MTAADFWVLGVNPGTHDGAAAITRNGELVCMVESERLVRRKRALDVSPSRAIRECLDVAGIDWSDLDSVAMGWNVPEFLERRGQEYDLNRLISWLTSDDASADIAYRALGAQTVEVGSAPALKPVFVPHHMAHAASGFYRSGLRDAAIVVADGTGEIDSVSIWHGTSDGLRQLRSWPNRHSIGRYYGLAAEWAGFDYWDGGKFMGLAAYGSPRYPTPLVPGPDGFAMRDFNFEPFEMVQPELDRSAKWLKANLEQFFSTHNYPFAPGTPEEVLSYVDFAASIQNSVEEAMFSLCQVARELTGSESLVLAGGVASNCSMNGMLSRSGKFSNVFVPPFPYDAGVSIGAADVVNAQAGFAPGAAIQTAAYGRGDFRHDRLDLGSSQRFVHRTLADKDTIDAVADMLADGKIVCWFDGPAEVGQRALGNRSILADPRDRKNVRRVNELKGREIWRPLAPSVHEDGWDLLFDDPPTSLNHFMLAAEQVREVWQRKIPAVVHIDGSARPQLVTSELHPRFSRLIAAFWRRSGVPALLNTSFNLAGEPIVYSAQDAWDTFQRSGFDALVVNGTLVVERVDGT